jgi:ABC-type antimicrobial peptide transport system ATPase subunit
LFFFTIMLKVKLMNKRFEEHSFSVELKTEGAVKRMSFLDKENGQVFFEGFLGKLTNIKMVEGVMLEIEGDKGTLRLDITQKEIEQGIIQKKIIPNYR